MGDRAAKSDKKCLTMAIMGDHVNWSLEGSGKLNGAARSWGETIEQLLLHPRSLTSEGLGKAFGNWLGGRPLLIL